MPPRKWKLRIQDILESVDAIQGYVRGMDLESFAGNQQVLDAVEYRFAVIGEATANIPDEIVDAHPEIPWRQMRGMRNVMVHAYFGVNTDTLWGTIQNDLPPLVPLLRSLLGPET